MTRSSLHLLLAIEFQSELMSGLFKQSCFLVPLLLIGRPPLQTIFFFLLLLPIPVRSTTTSSTWKHKGEIIRQHNMIPTQRSIDRLGGLNTTFHFESTVSRVFNYAVERARYELRDNPLHSLQLRWHNWQEFPNHKDRLRDILPSVFPVSFVFFGTIKK